MRFVVDASVIIQVSLAGGDLGPLVGHELVAPPILASEVTSVLSELAHRGEIPVEPARIAVARLGSIPITVERPGDHYERAWELARQLGWAKTYDAEYLVLGMLLDAPLLTLDERLRRGAGHLVVMPSLVDLTPAGLSTEDAGPR